MNIKTVIERKRDEYKAVYMESLATANANHGAMQAMDDLLIEIDKTEAKVAANDSTSSNAN